MRTILKLARMEARLFRREPIGLFFGLVFPAVLLFALGHLFPGFDEPSPELGGGRFIDQYPPVAIVFGLAMLGLTTLPVTLATYRQFGILRRLRTTPLPPVRLLWAQLLVFVVVAILAAILVMTVASLGFGVPAPEKPLWLALVFLLASASMLTTGLLIGSIARSSQTAIAIGTATWPPMLFFAGLWIPRALMSDTIRTISDYTPLGAGAQAMTDAWSGATPTPLHIAVGIVYPVIVGLVAARVFRWE